MLGKVLRAQRTSMTVTASVVLVRIRWPIGRCIGKNVVTGRDRNPPRWAIFITCLKSGPTEPDREYFVGLVAFNEIN